MKELGLVSVLLCLHLLPVIFGHLTEKSALTKYLHPAN